MVEKYGLGRRRDFLKALEVNRTEGLSYTEQFLSNEDLLPVPPEKRTWSGWNFVYLWALSVTNALLVRISETPS